MIMNFLRKRLEPISLWFHKFINILMSISSRINLYIRMILNFSNSLLSIQIQRLMYTQIGIQNGLMKLNQWGQLLIEISCLKIKILVTLKKKNKDV